MINNLLFSRLITFVTIFFFVFIAFGSLGSSSSSSSSSYKQNKPQKKSVTYEVQCICFDGCDLTYQNRTGGTNQTSVSDDWNYVFSGSPGDFIYLSAQLQGRGLVRTKIYIDGVLFQESSSNSEYGISNVSGSVPR